MFLYSKWLHCCYVTANIVTNEREIRSLLQYFSQRVQYIFEVYRKYSNKRARNTKFTWIFFTATTRKQRRLRRQCEKSIGCDEGRFTSPEECALAPRFISPKECGLPPPKSIFAVYSKKFSLCVPFKRGVPQASGIKTVHANNHPPPDSRLSRPPWERGQLKCIGKNNTQSKQPTVLPFACKG